MALLTTYFDAAGHPDGKHALIVGGYVASVQAWLRFERAWNARLKRSGIDVFHMADFMACKDGFENWKGREKEQDALLKKLAGVISDHARHSFSTMILLDDWAEINRLYALDENHCTPYSIAGFYSIDKAMRWLNRRDGDTAFTKFIFEDGDKHKGDFIWMVDQIVKWNKRLLAPMKPHFMPKKLAPLQAADFVLWEQFNASKTRLLTGAPIVWRPTLRQLSSVKHTWGMLNADRLIQFCEEYCVPKRGSGLTWTGPARVALERKARGEGRRKNV